MVEEPKAKGCGHKSKAVQPELEPETPVTLFFLKDISIACEKGTLTAVVGHVGSGGVEGGR